MAVDPLHICKSSGSWRPCIYKSSGCRIDKYICYLAVDSLYTSLLPVDQQYISLLAVDPLHINLPAVEPVYINLLAVETLYLLAVNPLDKQLIQKRLSLENTKSKFQSTGYKIKINTLWWASNVNMLSLKIFHLTENTSSYSVYHGLVVKSSLMCVIWHTFSCILYFVFYYIQPFFIYKSFGCKPLICKSSGCLPLYVQVI